LVEEDCYHRHRCCYHHCLEEVRDYLVVVFLMLMVFLDFLMVLLIVLDNLRWHLLLIRQDMFL
jgi:hypothetical protein